MVLRYSRLEVDSGGVVLRKMALWLAMVLMLLPVSVGAQVDAVYTSPDGSFSFNYPVGWEYLDDGAGTVLLVNHASVFEKTPQEFVGNDVLMQVMSPPMTRTLLDDGIGTTATDALDGLLDLLDSSFEVEGDPVALTLGNYAAARVDVRVVGAEGEALYDALIVAVEISEGEVGLMLVFTRPGGREDIMTPTYLIGETLQYSRPTADPATLQSIAPDNVAQLELLMVLGGHTTWVRALDFSGTKLASGDGDSVVRSWDVTTGESLTVIALERFLSAGPVFDPAGQHWLMGDIDGQVWLWDFGAAEIVTEYGPMGDVVWDVAFNADGSLVAAGGEDLTARVWDAATAEEQVILTGHRDGVTGVQFRPNHAQLGTTSWDATFRLWDLESGQQLAEVEGPRGGLTCLDFDPFGDLAAAGGRNGTVRIIDVNAAQEVEALEIENVEPIAAVAFSPDGWLIAVASQDSMVRLWETETWTLVTVLQGPNVMNDVAFSDDGKLLAGANDAGVVMVWGVR